MRDRAGRRAAPNERLQLDGPHAVDEAGAARRECIARWRRGFIWLGAVMLFGVMVGLMIGRLVDDRSPLAVLAASAPLVPKVLDVLPQHDDRGLVLQLLLEKPVAYQRAEASGAVILRLPGMQLAGAPQQGRARTDGRSLSWRVENQGKDVQVLLVGLGEKLDVHDRLEIAGDRWLLRITVALAKPPAIIDDSTPVGLEKLPAATPAQNVEETIPD